MHITLDLDRFFSTLFPHVDASNPDSIREALTSFYAYGTRKPTVTVTGEEVRVEIEAVRSPAQSNTLNQAIALCEKGKFAQAKKILIPFIEANPTVSEAHRVLGQVYSEEGQQEEAVSRLIDALRWDPKNNWAILMLANIFTKYYNDTESAMRYYEQSLKISPDDHISLNNIGATLMKDGLVEEGRRFFEQALKSNPNYPNTHYALGLVAEIEGNLDEAFARFTEAIRRNDKRDVLYQQSVKQAFEVAERIVRTFELTMTYEGYKDYLEEEGGMKVRIEEDSDIPTAGKFEFAENYNRAEHRLKYNPKYTAFEHIVMHELVHLDFAIEARKAGLNQLFVNTPEQKRAFMTEHASIIEKLGRMRMTEASIAAFMSEIYSGLNRQIFNAPIDLFIEEKIFDEFPSARPYQFLSLYGLLQEAIKSLENRNVSVLLPPKIVSTIKTYNLLGALQFKELYGIDLVRKFDPPFWPEDRLHVVR